MARRPRPTLLDPVTPATDPWIPCQQAGLLLRIPANPRSSPATSNLHSTLKEREPVAHARPAFPRRRPCGTSATKCLPALAVDALGPWCIPSLISQAVSCISIRCAPLSSGGRACSALSDFCRRGEKHKKKKEQTAP
nr:uncharacterized protein LOC109745040 [Aegilops tauschii subsp. strangulata]